MRHFAIAISLGLLTLVGCADEERQEGYEACPKLAVQHGQACGSSVPAGVRPANDCSWPVLGGTLSCTCNGATWSCDSPDLSVLDATPPSDGGD